MFSVHRRYSMVLADNVDGGDDLDLIVTTMNGNVFCFSTPAPHHPLKVSEKFCLFLLKYSCSLLINTLCTPGLEIS